MILPVIPSFSLRVPDAIFLEISISTFRQLNGDVWGFELLSQKGILSALKTMSGPKSLRAI